MPEPTSSIQFFDRYSRTIETEEIFGGGLLTWAYESGLGRFFCELIFKRAFFSRLYGAWAKRSGTKKQIPIFIERFGLDPAEFAEPVDSFRCFNDFFIRKLKPESRPIDSDPNALVFPADGRHLGFQDLSAVDSIYAKGQHFSLESILGDADLAKKFAGGSVVISRLCPVDYHRFHFPSAGIASDSHVINGPLYSVNPIALRRNIGILSENKRVFTELKTKSAGTIGILEIGATNVGSIVQTNSAGATERGAEKGYFEFGGSMTMTFFEEDRVQLADDLVEQSAAGIEIYARMGDRMATLK